MKNPHFAGSPDMEWPFSKLWPKNYKIS